MVKLRNLYGKIFAISEIAASLRLQIIFWVAWGLSILDLNNIGSSYYRDWRPPACWEHFPNCLSFISEGVLPQSYLYSTWMAVILGLLFVAAIGAWKKSWHLAHFALLIVISWKYIWSMVIFDYGSSNFEYFHLIPSFALLLTHNKIYQLRFLWAWTYFLTPLVKLDDSWIVGTYFTSLQSGLAYVPDALVPYITNAVILFEMFCSLGLLSANKKIFRFSLYGWTAFHLYSTVLVGFYYPVRCLAMLWAIFGFPEDSRFKERIHVLPRSVVAPLWAFAFLLLNLAPSLVTKDPNETFEAMNYGLHMFNSNHQCINHVVRYDAEGNVVGKLDFSSKNAMTRCYPQWTLQRLHLQCTSETPRVSWQLLHSKNGGPFYAVVNLENACDVQFKAFRKNDWLMSSSTGAALMGYPEKNGIYPRRVGPAPQIFNTPQIHLSSLQTALLEHLQGLKVFYSLIWVCLSVFFLRLYFSGRSLWKI